MSWTLAHEDHAIERVSFGFHFIDQISSKPWNALIDEAGSFLPQNGLNSINDELSLNLNMAPVVAQLALQGGLAVGGVAAGNMGQAAGTSVAGRYFRAFSGTDLREELFVGRNRLVYTTTLYDGWTSFKKRLFDISKSILDSYLESTGVQIVKLEYWDRFVFSGMPSSADYRSLLKTNSTHLPSFFFESGELWHSHVGYFAKPGLSQRRLVNLNVDVLDLIDRQAASDDAPNQERRSVGIYSMAQDTVNPEAPLEDADVIVETMDEMHTLLKGVLADVINDETAARISLYGRKES